MYEKVSTDLNFVEREKQTEKFWREHHIFEKRRTAARTVRNNLKAFIQKPFIPNLLQRPPLRLNIFIMVSNIRVIQKFWREHHIFEKSIESRKDCETYTFYDGPPTANGKPHIGHVLTRVIRSFPTQVSRTS